MNEERCNEEIDFVIAWVDGSDPEWFREFQRYRNPGVIPDSLSDAADISTERYRDWDMLRYWFRGVERFAPWVRRIHFITWGHLPEWLDTSNPKIHVVRHEDYIPADYLPVFSSCPIELLMHRIEGLSERFVYFNDDMYLCRPIDSGRFFAKGLPVDIARLNILHDDLIDHNALECVRIINRRHNKRKCIGRNVGKWFNIRYSIGDMLKTASLLPWSFFGGFKNHHSPQPFLRSTFELLWEEEREELDATCRNRFRQPTDLIQWLMRYEQLARGDFMPHGYSDTLLTQVSDVNMESIAQAVVSRRYSMICINDSNSLESFDRAKGLLQGAFQAILPDQSSFEK